LKARYARVLGFIARWPRAIIAVVVLICALALTQLPTGKGGFFRSFAKAISCCKSSPRLELPCQRC